MVANLERPIYFQRSYHLRDPAKSTTPQQSAAAWKRVDIYRQWLLREYLQADTHDTIIMMPLNADRPRYRDEVPPSSDKPQQLHDSLLLASISGAPEVVVPCKST